MKKQLTKFILSLILCFSFASLFTGTKVSAESKQPWDYKYFIISESKYLRVYKTDNLTSPLYNIEFNTKLLPENDQKSLSDGLLIADENELKKVLEDFTG